MISNGMLAAVGGVSLALFAFVVVFVSGRLFKATSGLGEKAASAADPDDIAEQTARKIGLGLVAVMRQVRDGSLQGIEDMRGDVAAVRRDVEALRREAETLRKANKVPGPGTMASGAAEGSRLFPAALSSATDRPASSLLNKLRPPHAAAGEAAASAIPVAAALSAASQAAAAAEAARDASEDLDALIADIARSR